MWSCLELMVKSLKCIPSVLNNVSLCICIYTHIASCIKGSLKCLYLLFAATKDKKEVKCDSDDIPNLLKVVPVSLLRFNINVLLIRILSNYNYYSVVHLLLRPVTRQIANHTLYTFAIQLKMEMNWLHSTSLQ